MDKCELRCILTIIDRTIRLFRLLILWLAPFIFSIISFEHHLDVPLILLSFLLTNQVLIKKKKRQRGIFEIDGINMLNIYWLLTGFSSCYCRKCLFKSKWCTHLSEQRFFWPREFDTLLSPVPRTGWAAVLASTACMQAQLSPSVPAGTCDIGEAHSQLPLSTAQLAGAGNQPSLQTPAWARVRCWTSQQSNPVVDKTHRHYWTVQAEKIIYCISYAAFIFISIL